MNPDPGEVFLTSRDSGPTVGHRYVVRHRLDDGSATDTIGFLDHVDAEALTITSVSGVGRRISRAAVVVARRVSDAPGGPGPLRTTPAELEQVAAHGWVAEHERLGDWWLRSGGGFTGRANSALAVGDPGVGASEAAAAITAHAARHAITPMAQVVHGSAEEARLTALGWRETYEATDVLVHRLGALLDGREIDPRVSVEGDLTPDWLAAFASYRSITAHEAVVRRILAGDGDAGLGLLRNGRGEVVAIGRAHVHAGWTGIAALWTRPDHRRQGLATALMTELGRWSGRRGARNVYLQVARANTGAREAYAALGFALHHSYRYLTPSTHPAS